MRFGTNNMKKRYQKFERWLITRSAWMSWGGFLVMAFLSVLNLVTPDILPFVDELTLLGITFLFMRVLWKKGRGSKKPRR